MQLHQPRILEQVAALDAAILVVSFAPLDHLKKWIPFWRENFLETSYQELGRTPHTDLLARTEFVADPQLTAYHAYGLGRNSLLKIYGPKIIWQYVKWGVQGKKLTKPREDVQQRGGDFVVNRQHVLTLAHTGRNQSDRPKVGDILAGLARA